MNYSIMTKELVCNKTLKRLREEILEMSQDKMAKAIGVRQATISDWELGNTKKPSLTFKQAQKLDALLAEKGLRFKDLDLETHD